MISAMMVQMERRKGCQYTAFRKRLGTATLASTYGEIWI